CNDRSMVVQRAIDRARLYVWRNDHRRNTGSEQPKVKWRRRTNDSVRRVTSLGRFMVINSTVFVVHNCHDTALPHIIVAAQVFIHAAEKHFPTRNAMVEMLVIGGKERWATLTVIAGFDKAVLRQPIVPDKLSEAVVFGEKLCLMMKQQSFEAQRCAPI